MGWLPLVKNSWTPILLPGLVFWVDASVSASIHLSGSKVTQWDDQSGHNYNLIQATGANQPTYQATGFNSNFPTVRFTVASSTWMATTANSVAMGTGLVGSLFGVGQKTSSTGPSARSLSYIENGQTIDTASSHSAAWILVSGAGNTDMTSYRGGFHASDSNMFLDGTNYRFGNIYDNVNDTNYVNNVAGTPVATSGLTWTSPGTIIVSAETTSSPTAFWDGPISELVVTNMAISIGDRLSLDNYFRAKWGL